jgi:hypothetical protein
VITTPEPPSPPEDDDYLPVRRRRRREWDVSPAGLLILGCVGFLVIVSLAGVAWKLNRAEQLARQRPPTDNSVRPVAKEPPDDREVHQAEVTNVVQTVGFLAFVACAFAGTVALVCQMTGCTWLEGIAYTLIGIVTLFLAFIVLAVLIGGVSGSGRRPGQPPSTSCRACGAVVDRGRNFSLRCPVCGAMLF